MMKNNNLKITIKIVLTSLIASLVCASIIYAATTVGINISTTGTLDVTGESVLTGDTSITGTLNVTGNTTFTTASSTGIVKFSNINSDTGSINFGDDNIYTTGNIGIGTSSPYAKLSVVGEIVAEYFTATSSTAISALHGNLVIDNTNTEALLIRKDADGGDMLTVDTTNNKIIENANVTTHGDLQGLFRKPRPRTTLSGFENTGWTTTDSDCTQSFQSDEVTVPAVLYGDYSYYMSIGSTAVECSTALTGAWDLSGKDFSIAINGLDNVNHLDTLKIRFTDSSGNYGQIDNVADYIIWPYGLLDTSTIGAGEWQCFKQGHFALFLTLHSALVHLGRNVLNYYNNHSIV